MCADVENSIITLFLEKSTPFLQETHKPQLQQARNQKFILTASLPRISTPSSILHQRSFCPWVNTSGATRRGE